MNTDCDKQIAVRVRNAYKRYSVSNVILHGLNMTVPEGTVYVYDKLLLFKFDYLYPYLSTNMSFVTVNLSKFEKKKKKNKNKTITFQDCKEVCSQKGKNLSTNLKWFNPFRIKFYILLIFSIFFDFIF